MDRYRVASAPKSTRRRSEPRQGGRPPEIEEPLNARLIHPASQRLATALIPTPVTPNAVSVAGAVVIAAAGLTYALGAPPLSVVVGFGLHAAWHVLDGADGDLARRTGRSSAAGEIVDGLCDHGGHILLYVALAAAAAQSLGGWAWALASAAGASRIVQANHYESARRIYLSCVYGTPWLKRSLQAPRAARPRPGTPGAILTALGRAYFALSDLTSPDSRRLESGLEALRARPDAIAPARDLSRRTLLTQVKRASLLSSNYRTLALGLSMVAGSAVYFFLLECTALNLVLVWSALAQGRLNRRLAANLAAPEGA